MIQLLLFLTLAFGLIDAKVISTRYIQDVLPLIDKETWFLVDLDNCMYEGAQALGHANWFYDEMQKRLEKGMTRDEAIADCYPGWIKTQKVCKVKPLEEDFIKVLIELQTKGATLMGLTHRQPLVFESTLAQIASLGFDFSLASPSQESFSLPAKTPALYTSGVLFVGDYNKKIDLFLSFLSIIGKKPKKVVFIDDKKKNVDELETLSSIGIDYTGVHYTAIDHAKPIYHREIAEYQLKHLDQILSNEAALILMQNGIE
ncbi:MAG: DUF2608 domain-containing protein [Parachlamydiaceae bacterium]